MARFRKMVLGALLGLFATCVLFSVSIHLYYYEDLPRHPDEKRGRIHRMVVNHGFVRYGSEKELHALRLADDLPPTGVVLLITAIVLGLEWGIFKVRGAPR